MKRPLAYSEALKIVCAEPEYRKRWSDLEFVAAVRAARHGMTLIKEKWKDGAVYRLHGHHDPMTLDGVLSACEILDWY